MKNINDIDKIAALLAQPIISKMIETDKEYSRSELTNLAVRIFLDIKEKLSE